MRARKAWIALAALICLAAGALPSAAAETAADIVRKLDELEASSGTRMELSMTVKPAGGGAERTFAVKSLARREADGSETSMIEFVEPRTVRGLRILSRGSDSWAFFPSTSRVRKIAGAARSGSVQGVGGDFSYDDLGGGTWAEDYAWVLAGETGAEWKLEGARAGKDSSYDAVRLTVDKGTGLARRAEFGLKAEGGYFKELAFEEFKDFGGRLKASRMTMSNPKKGTATVVAVREAAFDVDFSEAESRLFDPSRFDK